MVQIVLMAARLPPVFLEWLRDNGVDPAVYDVAASLPRTIRCD